MIQKNLIKDFSDYVGFKIEFADIKAGIKKYITDIKTHDLNRLKN